MKLLKMPYKSKKSVLDQEFLKKMFKKNKQDQWLNLLLCICM